MPHFHWRIAAGAPAEYVDFGYPEDRQVALLERTVCARHFRDWKATYEQGRLETPREYFVEGSLNATLPNYVRTMTVMLELETYFRHLVGTLRGRTWYEGPEVRKFSALIHGPFIRPGSGEQSL